MGDGSIFLGNRSIGEPPVLQLMAMETGSQAWIRCRECDNYGNAFNPEDRLLLIWYQAFLLKVQRCAHFNSTIKTQRSSSSILRLEMFMFSFKWDLKGFPAVRLRLAEATKIDLDGNALFQRTKDWLAFCVAAVEAKENIIGLKAQHYYNVGSDLEPMRISFQRIDCELLVD